jgi:broad specificity phosphatase PhoE
VLDGALAGESGLLLARHGQTDDNIEPIRAQGFRDTPLNELGREQARALAVRVADSGLQIGSLWCSDLSRAAETAWTVGERIGLEPRPDPRLREGNRGDWEGQLFIDIAREDPEGYAAWMRAGADFRFPGGESLQEHADRVWAALQDIRAVGPLPALVVCHRGSIRTVLCRQDPRGLAAFHEYDVPNTGLVAL